MIGNKKIQTFQETPWGVLHNDYPVEVVVEGITYPTITHSLYASILCNNNYKIQLSQIENVESMKKYAHESFSKCKNDIIRDALVLAYNQYAIQNSKFKDLLAVLGDVEFYGENKYKGNFNYIGMLAQNTIKDLKTRFAPANTNKEVELFSEVDVIGPLYITSIVIDGKNFNSVVSFIYYKLFEYFSDADFAYTKLKRGVFKRDIRVPLLFEDEKEIPRDTNPYYLLQINSELQGQFLTRSIENAFKNAFAYKLQTYPNIAKLFVSMPKNFEIVEQEGFLMDFINPITKSVLAEYGNINSTPYEIIDVSVLLQNANVKNWLLEVRVPDILYNINLFYTYFQRPIHPNNLGVFIKTMYSQCFFESENILVYNYPIEFIDIIYVYSNKLNPNLWNMISSHNENLYLLWVHLSMIVDFVYKQSVKRNNSFYNIIQGYVRETPRSFEMTDIYMAIRTILLSLKQMSMNFFSRFVIGNTELTLVQNVLRVNPMLSYVPRNIDRNLARQISYDVINTFGSSDSEKVATKIYSIVNYIHNSEKSIYTQTRINMYS
jgi:hypothetical protein